VYLDELGAMEALPMGVGLMVLTTLEGDEAKSQARRAIERCRERGVGFIEMMGKYFVTWA
jgi:predicted transposase YdaD